MTRRNRIIFYCVAWTVALLATNPSLELISLVWMFPIGLAAFLYAPASQGGWGALGLATAVYGWHAVLYFRAKQRRFVFVLAAVLIALLICNVSGCRAMLKSH